MVWAWLILSSCATTDSDTAVEPLRGWDGDLADSADSGDPELPPESLPLTDDHTSDSTTTEPDTPPQATSDESDGWLNPKFVHQVTAPGSQLINFGRLDQYEIIPPPAGLDCPALIPWVEGEQLATVDAVLVRGTRGVTAEAVGEDGTLLHAHAVSYTDPSQVPAIATAYADSFLECPNESASTTSVELELAGIGRVDVLYVDQTSATDFRIVVLHRSNLIVNIFAWVDGEDEQVFEAFVANAAERLMAARGEEEILPEDLK